MKGSRTRLLAGIVGWVSALIMFFPIFWMVVTSFKSEIDAIEPSLAFTPTLQSYVEVNERANYMSFALNSLIELLGSTLAALMIGLPAAYALAFYPGRRTKDLLLWMLSTKMMPAVGVLVPMYLMARSAGILDTRLGLIIIFTLSNLPIVIWMLYSFFKDVPSQILEAGRMDGARFWTQMRYILIPISLPGIASTALLSIILCWNEAFWSINLTASRAAPLTAYIASFSSPEMLFWAKLSAASTMAVAPILIMGWITQRRLVRGLTFGAVK